MVLQPVIILTYTLLITYLGLVEGLELIANWHLLNLSKDAAKAITTTVYFQLKIRLYGWRDLIHRLQNHAAYSPNCR